MIDGNIFKKYGIDYETVLGMLRCIVFRIVGCHSNRECVEEYMSEGWLVICELIRDYDSSRGKITTYLWMPVYWALMRYKVKKDYHNFHFEYGIPEISTESISNSNIIEGNPWIMSPDVVYEKKEQAKVYHKLMAIHREEVKAYIRKTPKFADLATRQSFSRKRRRTIIKLQNMAREILESKQVY